MRSPIGAFIFICIMLILDMYVFQAVKSVTQNAGHKTKSIIYILFWTLSILAVVGFLLFAFTEQQFIGKKVRTYLFATIIGLFLAKLTAIIFFIADDLRRGIQWAAGKLFFNNTEGDNMSGDGISRSVFLSWIGLAAGTTLFGSLVYGFSNKYNYNLKKTKLSFPNLPEAFKGLKIVHISDIHSGSFTNIAAVEHGVQMILDQKPDVVFFTGDLVNDKASEMTNLINVFNKVTAPMGVYSTLGNHDYGDYVAWPVDGLSKTQNLANLKNVHAQLGWKLLMNEHIVLQKNGQEIAVLGVENWSAKGRFPKYGKLNQAYVGADKYPFKILLSHDPSHWEGEVLGDYKDIDIVLSSR